jgi:hypothetical protein
MLRIRWISAQANGMAIRRGPRRTFRRLLVLNRDVDAADMIGKPNLGIPCRLVSNSAFNLRLRK